MFVVGGEFGGGAGEGFVGCARHRGKSVGFYIIREIGTDVELW